MKSKAKFANQSVRQWGHFILLRLVKAVSFVVAIVALSGFGTCAKEKGWHDREFSTRVISRQPSNVEIPASLWEQIVDFARTRVVSDSDVKPSGEGEKKEEGGAKEAAVPKVETKEKPIPTEFAEIKVYLIEKNRGLLNRENHELSFGAGGGEIDLSDFVQPLKGSFYFAVDFLSDVAAKDKKVFFLSNGVARTVRGVKLGAGCESYLDVTSAFEKAMNNQGFLVNTTDGRHVSALSGTYFFAGIKEGKLRLASLTIRDSQARHLQCKR